MKTLSLTKVLLLVVLGLAGFQTMRAQTEVQRLEGEINVGFNVATGRYLGTSAGLGLTVGGELRYNFRNSPFDGGVWVNYTSFAWPTDLPEGTFWTSSTNFALVGDYNFRQGASVNPFVGAGLGMSFRDADRGCGPVFMPRVGVELWSHLRLTLSYEVNRKYYNGFSFTVGWAIGGGAKK
ncbi:MAG: porin family protein [Staphylococcus sp.]|nr:porin family protein [Staphylococcus sp.]